jgi:hypothetical protein
MLHHSNKKGEVGLLFDVIRAKLLLETYEMTRWMRILLMMMIGGSDLSLIVEIKEVE